MSLGETFNPIDSFGNQIWRPDPNPRLLAKVFLLYLDGEVKAGRVSNATAMGMLSRLREAISPSVRITWDEYVPVICRVGQERLIKTAGGDTLLTPLMSALMSEEAIKKTRETKSSIEKWVEARGGSQRVLKAIRESRWPDTSTWEFNDRKFAVADVRFFAEAEEKKLLWSRCQIGGDDVGVLISPLDPKI